MKYIIVSLAFSFIGIISIAQGKYDGGRDDGYASLTANNLTLSIDLLSIDLLSFKNKTFEVFPNPAGNFLHIKIERSLKENELVVFDILGNEVIKIIVPSTKINIGHLASGIYVIKIGNNIKKFFKK